MSKSANPYRVAWPIALTLVALTIATDDLDHLLAFGELAGAHSAAKHG